MSTFSSPSPQDARELFDTGPLSWVVGEIREALNRSRDALREAAAQDAGVQTTALRHAKSYLHQAHGALQIVDVDGVSIITETVEDLLDRADGGQLPMNAELADVIGNAYQALTEYLDELLAGMPHQPVRLFPYYRTLLEARGAERIHPADLFFPNLAVRPTLPAINPPAEIKPAHYVGLRQRYEKALLPFLKSSDRNAELANAAVMRDVVGEIENLQGNPQARAFWWVMHGLAEAVAADQIPNEIYVKQLFARINLQIRRLCQGSPSIAERLLRDALFFIARIAEPSARGRQIRQTYQLDGLVPADYEKKRYGQVDPDALAGAKDRLSQAKTIWNRIVGGDAGMADSFEHEMRMLADAGSRLNSAPLSKLLRELKGIARHAAHAKPGELLGLEMAASLLFVENSLSQIGHLPDNFAERADAMTARLLSVVAGDQPLQDAPWLDDMSRQALQQQTMTALAGEMQGSLRQVEKILDEFFRDPAQHDGLGQLDQILHQIEGALAVLDQDDAMQAVRHTREAVASFHSRGKSGSASADAADNADAADAEDSAAFQHVAQNVGALSFFIETLQHQSDSAKKRFSFDRDKGLLRANLIEPGGKQNGEGEASAAANSDSDTNAADSDPGDEPEGMPLTTVEDELAFHQQKSAEIAMSLSVEPDNQALQAQLKESLEKIRMDATLVDNPEANDRAQAGIDALKRPDFAESTDALAEIITATVPAMPADEALPPVVAPSTDEAIDAELLEIFLMEAKEVLGAVRQTMPEARNQPHNQEHLTTLRRSFHTLKGSGRMVGLMAFGEAAWSIEQVLNLRLAESRGGDPELFALLDKAAEVLDAWVRDLKTQGRSACTPDAIVAAAERIKSGGQFHYEETLDLEATPVAVDPEGLEERQEPVADPAQDQAHTLDLPAPATAPEFMDAGLTASPSEQRQDAEADLPLPDLGMEDAASTENASGVFASAEVAAFSEPAEPEELQLSDAEVQAQFGGLEGFGAPALNELARISDGVDTDANKAADASSSSDEAVQVQAPAPQPPSAATPAAGAEVITFPTVHPPETSNNDNVKRIGDLEISVPLHNIYLAETDDLVRVLAQDIAEWSHEPDRAVSVQSVHAAHSLAGSSATVGFASLHELAHALEMVLQFLLRKPVRLQPHEFDLLAESIERLKQMLQKFALGDMPENKPEYVRLLQSLRQDLDLRSEMAELAAASHDDAIPFLMADTDLSAPIGLPDEEPEATGQDFVEHESAVLQDDALGDVQDVADEAAGIDGFDEAAAMTAAVPVEQTEHAEPDPFAFSEDSVEEAGSSGAPSLDEEAGAGSGFVQQIRDELDADLLPVFLEEGRDMFPQMGTALRGWQERPRDIVLPQSVLRLLHTLKGSARMAGAMRLGQHLHEMETRIENIMHLGTPELLALEDVLVRYDQALQMFELLQHPVPDAVLSGNAESAAAALAQASLPADKGQAQGLPATAALQVPQPPQIPLAPSAPLSPLVRVRADILDRLVNQAGEVSISRSRLENEVGSLQQSLSELTDNVARLRDQLREIEMQAETQITSRMAHSADREFDPLEFDRFTRLQELTRMMAESVNDVGSVQQNLTRTLDSAVADLSAQARLTRDLQQDLMRARMVQFASISERLFRVTRQAAKETDKRVNLDIRGGAVEMDRGVLEKMTGPFEHLLRNAIVHGVETREARRAAGKPETGELLVEVRQEGNEVVIQFSDDGQGLDLGRIRDKAATLGLLADGGRLTDEEAGDLIFHPGFSTADEITELAGRGVGMDVVRSEAASLGGRVSTWTQPGKGTQFAIRLPLTLAVTQVVLLSTGGMTYAVPSVLVEQVQQLKTNALAAAYNEGAVVWQGQRVAMHYLSTLLGNTRAVPVSRQYSSLLILKSGNDRVAVHVDEVIGNREVVVKNIGPQLSRMIGVAGATVLGSGEIVLILNPVPLAQRLAQDSQRAPRLAHEDVSDAMAMSMGAVAEIRAGEPSAPDSGPVQGLRRQPIVMVVDDSLTVRRVTQRLLSRENFQVVLAKDGVDALQHLQSVTPDVMLVDIEMPRMDGFDLTRNVRGDERTRHIPIIMITSRTAEKHRNYALELGVNEYLGKPYQEQHLLGLIGGFVSKDASVD
ncbi:Hpt domain-containing protein [Noviherbaspirillum sp. CPCC 100848]|uniref:histidine kinase n=1 Tax=Noviherbaspirillum album TaxID=3080276 RepID=A0ABU6J6J5_9BURK|nr:Hpt domain-containing protein [Noviherbaspirillum sp. CPCC 100848]MEC4719257.1 Hpt domain-containing protein [Noviherbaspirillum sp. CPCC 100848]